MRPKKTTAPEVGAAGRAADGHRQRANHSTSLLWCRLAGGIAREARLCTACGATIPAGSVTYRRHEAPTERLCWGCSEVAT
jgi:hypothetical protein